MASEIISRDQNHVTVLAGITDDSNQYVTMLRIDPTTKRLLVSATGLPDAGTVTSVSVVTANGVSGSVATSTTTPAITLTLGAITPTSVNGLTLASQTIGFTIAGGTTSKTLTVPLDASVSGTNTGDQDLSGLVTKATYDANSILYATTDNTPLALTVGASTIVGRKATGDIVALSGAEALAITGGAAALSGTQNEIAYFNSATTIASLAVATYPSLTELSYVKGLSSAVQTQINNRLQLAGGTMTGDLTMGDAKQVVLTAPSADVTCTGFSTSAFNAGYTSTAVGDLVYLDSSATWQKCDADAIATAGGMLGIALAVVASGNPVKVALPGSFVRVNAWDWTPGTTLYISETAGGIATAIPTGADGVVREIGWACNADYIYFMPNSGNSTVVA